VPFPDFFLTLQQIFDFMKKYFILLVSSLLFGACSSSSDEDEPAPKPADTRTVLVYMAAENNLDAFSEYDINEMKEGSKTLSDDDRLIIYCDNQASNKPYLARVKDGQLIDKVEMEESLSADPALLEKTLRTVREKYPATSYGLVLWGHANGWLISNDTVKYNQTRAYGYASSTKGQYWMNIPSMTRAITNAMGSDRLRFVFADCCEMGCVEVAYELRHITDWFIASPAEIPDSGAPYDAILANLFDRSESFYQGIIDTYYNRTTEEIKKNPNKYYNVKSGDLEGYSLPLAAFKSSELDNLVQSTARLLSTIPDKLTPETGIDFTQAMYYGFSSSQRYAYDMRFMLKRLSGGNGLSDWDADFRKAVPYSRFSPKWLTAFTASGQLATDMDDFVNIPTEDCCSVSMFFPASTYKSTKPNWNTAIQNFQWNNIIRWQQYGW